MKDKADRIKSFIIYFTLTIVGLYFLFSALIKAQGFFAPLVMGILLAMLVVPVAKKLEKIGFTRGWAAFFSDLLLIGFAILLFWVIGLQIQKIRQDWPELKKELIQQAEVIDNKLDEFSWLRGQKGISFEEQIKKVTDSENEDQGASTQKSSSGISTSGIWGIVKAFFGFLGSMLLVFIYVFFFLLYRDKFRKSLLKFSPKEDNQNTRSIVNNSARIAQQYLWGKFILIIFLAIFYSVGLTISGIKYAIFISIIAAVLSLIPYIGNIIGAIFAAFMAILATGSGAGPLIGVAITFSITQFIESYILEPYIVGHKVDMNPPMTIIAVIFGEFIWGVPGMILAIPVLGIVKVICDHVTFLQPIGYAIGEEGINGGDNLFTRFGKWIQGKFS